MGLFKKNKIKKYIISELKDVFQTLKSCYVKLRTYHPHSLDFEYNSAKLRFENIKANYLEKIPRKAKKLFDDCEITLKQYEELQKKIDERIELQEKSEESSQIEKESTHVQNFTFDWNSRISAITGLLSSLDHSSVEAVQLLQIVERANTFLAKTKKKNSNELTNAEKLEEEVIERLLVEVETRYPELYDISKRKSH